MIIVMFAVEWEAIEKAIIAISRQARQVVWISEVGSITTIIVASVVIVLLLRRLNRSGLAAIQALAAEEATRLAYNELNQIFNTATDGIRVIDRNFNMIRVNETFSRMSGINEAEVLGKKCFAVFRGPVCNTPGCPLTRVLNGEERIEFDVNQERNDGSIIPCIVTAVSFRDPCGALIGIVEAFRDISDREKAEELIRQLSHAVDQSPSIIMITDSEGIIEYVNPKFTQLTGYP